MSDPFNYGDVAYVCEEWLTCPSQREPISQPAFNPHRPRHCDAGHVMSTPVDRREWETAR